MKRPRKGAEQPEKANGLDILMHRVYAHGYSPELLGHIGLCTISTGPTTIQRKSSVTHVIPGLT